jgi:hypothetical protein
MIINDIVYPGEGTILETCEQTNLDTNQNLQQGANQPALNIKHNSIVGHPLYPVPYGPQVLCGMPL